MERHRRDPLSFSEQVRAGLNLVVGETSPLHQNPSEAKRMWETGRIRSAGTTPSSSSRA